MKLISFKIHETRTGHPKPKMKQTHNDNGEISIPLPIEWVEQQYRNSVDTGDLNNQLDLTDIYKTQQQQNIPYFFF